MRANSSKFGWMVLLLPLLTFTLATGGCATNRPAGEQFDDASITAAVKAKFAADTDVAAHNIDVDTLHQVVTLSGEVNSSGERSKAGQLAAATDGVKSVINNLKVKS